MDFPDCLLLLLSISVFLLFSFFSLFLHFFSCRLRCLLYTSDAADDLLCVDLGGRRIIKNVILPTITLPECQRDAE